MFLYYFCLQMPGRHRTLRCGQGAQKSVPGLPPQEMPTDGHE